MTSNVSNSQALISQDPTNQSKFIIEGAETIQLKKASTTESRFDWGKYFVEEVAIENAKIVDRMDINFFSWLINKGVKINFSEAAPSVSPPILPELTSQLNYLHKKNIKVMTGSSITIPIAQGPRGFQEAKAAYFACDRLGFKIKFC